MKIRFKTNILISTLAIVSIAIVGCDVKLPDFGANSANRDVTTLAVLRNVTPPEWGVRFGSINKVQDYYFYDTNTSEKVYNWAKTAGNIIQNDRNGNPSVIYSQYGRPYSTLSTPLGIGSVTIGDTGGAIAQGDYSAMIGNGAVNGMNSLGFGAGINNYGDYAFALGGGVQNYGDYSLVGGGGPRNNSDNSFMWSAGGSIGAGAYNFGFGSGNTISTGSGKTATYSTVFGTAHTINATSKSITNSMVIGMNGRINDSYAFVWAGPAESSYDKASNGEDTFSIYTEKGLNGVFVNKTPLKEYFDYAETHLRSPQTNTMIRVDENGNGYVYYRDTTKSGFSVVFKNLRTARWNGSYYDDGGPYNATYNMVGPYYELDSQTQPIWIPEDKTDQFVHDGKVYRSEIEASTTPYIKGSGNGSLVLGMGPGDTAKIAKIFTTSDYKTIDNWYTTPYGPTSEYGQYDSGTIEISVIKPYVHSKILTEDAVDSFESNGYVRNQKPTISLTGKKSVGNMVEPTLFGVLGSASVGYNNTIRDSNSYSFAAGRDNYIFANQGMTIGNGNRVEDNSPRGIALGWKSTAMHRDSFVWNVGAATWTSNTWVDGVYYSHGEGTFNINPKDGLAGFYIGQTNLADHIALTPVWDEEAEPTISSAQEEAIVAAFGPGSSFNFPIVEFGIHKSNGTGPNGYPCYDVYVTPSRSTASAMGGAELWPDGTIRYFAGVNALSNIFSGASEQTPVTIGKARVKYYEFQGKKLAPYERLEKVEKQLEEVLRMLQEFNVGQ